MARASIALALCALVTVSAACATSTAPEPPPPDAAMIADLCALLAAPGDPERHVVVLEDHVRAAPLYKRLEDTGRTFDNRRRASKPWGHCPSTAAPYDQFLVVTPDRLLAERSGSWKMNRMNFGYGGCLYEKVNDSWKLITCQYAAHEGPL